MKNTVTLTENELRSLVENTVIKIIESSSLLGNNSIKTRNGNTYYVLNPSEIENIPRFLRPAAQACIDNFGYLIVDEHNMPFDDEYEFEDIRNEIDKLK